MKTRSATLIMVILIAAVFFSAARAFAAPAQCSLVKVSKKGMRLSDVIASGDIKELLIIQRMNSIQNPYDLKEGILIIVPEKSFIEKAKEMPFGEMIEAVNEYRGRIPASTLREVAESIAGAKDAAEKGSPNDDAAFKPGASTISLGQMKGTAPEEVERVSFPRRPKY